MLFNFDKFFNGKTAENDFTDNDACRMAAYFIQDGKCYVTGAPLLKDYRELHHRQPKQYSGKDVPENLILLTKRVHRMVHTEDFEEFYTLLGKEPMTEAQLAMVNQLRLEARRKPVEDWKEGGHHERH